MVDKNRALHFIYKHPLFGKRKETQSGVWFERSVYYLWYEYLRRNEKYKAYCGKNAFPTNVKVKSIEELRKLAYENSKTRKKGTKTIAKLYEDFGVIHSVGFKSWWRERGRFLFCEKVDLQRVEEISSTKEYEEYQADEVLTIAIPINKNVAWLRQQINDKISLKRKEYGVGSRQTASGSLYPLHTTADIPSLIRALRVWDEYTDGNRQRQLRGDRKRSLLEVGVALDKRSRQQRELDDTEGAWEISTKQMIFRLNKTAKHLIENVGKGRFPQHNARG